MDNKFSVVKNGLCLTFDNFGRTGYYNLIIKGNKIFDIDYNNEFNSDREIYKKYPDVDIIDAANKIVVPSFFNSLKDSTYHLSGVFLKHSDYEDIDANVSLRLVEKHLSSSKVNPDLVNLFTLSFVKSLLNGETFVNESSELITAELLTSNALGNINSKPDVVFTVYDNYISDYCLGVNRFHCIGLRDENDLNNYSLASVRKAIQKGNKRAVIESLQSVNNSDTLRNIFGKSFIKVLDDNDLLTPNLIIANPVFLTNEELNVIGEKKVNVILQPSDWLNLSIKEPEFDSFVNRKLNLLVGTGISGKSVFSELKVLKNIIPAKRISAESLLKMIITNPANVFGILNICGSLEKNKLANFLMLDLNDIRNFMALPEIESEKICGFIIDYLDEKDISDIFFRGLHFLNQYKCEFVDNAALYEINCSLSKKIFEKGKYSEFKEKRLMRRRVGKLLMTSDDEEHKSLQDENMKIPVDDSGLNILEGESEFRIIGTKKVTAPIVGEDSDEKYNDSSWLDDLSRHVKELSGFENGFDLIDDAYQDFADVSEKKKDEYSLTGEKKPTKKIFFDDDSVEHKVEELDKFHSSPVITKPVPDPLIEPKKVTFKKSKLKFGFDDSNNPPEDE